MKHSLQFPLLKSIFLFLGIFISLNSFGLVSTYTFTQSSAAYTAITGGTILGDTANDDDNFTALSIGFTFYYNGTAYTTIGVNANGYIGFGTMGPSSHAVISSFINNNVISALNYDLQGQPGAVLRYQTTGAAPNRVLVVQWLNYRLFGGTGDNLNFQIRLNEASHSIDIKYGVCTSSTVQLAEIGLRGASIADFNNRYVSDTVNTWATSLAGTSDTNICVLNSVFKPATGQTYSWAPPAPPAAPITLTFTAITPTGMTLNWVDNSTSENTFQVYRSTDNINFTLISTVASTTSATTGTAYNLLQTGLISATTYYYRIFAVGITPSTTALNGNSATLTGTICGTYTVGPTGTYTTIKSAITALQTSGLSCPVILELQAAYVSSVDSFPLTIPFLGCNAVRPLTLRPASGATNLKLIGNAPQILDLNGSTWFTVDGRAGGLGSTINLTVYDSSRTGSAIRFSNDAQNNTIAFLGIRGATTGTTTTGVIQFANAATTAGNSNNAITRCDITMSDSLPQVLLYSNTNTGTNASNTISNNNFHDWYSATGSNYAMNIGANNASWTINANSFYQPAAQTFTTSTSTHAAINIAGGGGPGGGASGNGFVITNNFIGGSAVNCGGSPMTYNGTGSPRFNGINMNVGTTTASEVQGNTIQNIILTTAATAGGGPGGNATIFNGINIGGGQVNVGTTTQNTIGSGTTNNSIQTIASSNGVQTVGINTSSAGTVSIQANVIGGIFANDSASLNNTSLIGILASAGTVTIRNNSIGSSTQVNSMMNAASTGAGANTVTGISSSNTTTCSIQGNAIRNLSNQFLGTTAGTVRGIATSGGVNSITANTIELLSNASPQAGTSGTASVLGISQSSTQAGQSISSNIVRLLSNKSISGNFVVTGIYYSGGANGANVIEKNKIYGLSATSDTSVASINGMQINGGRSVIVNNMISVGSDTSGNSYTSANEYTGILKSTTGSNSFYFNSINVSGGNVASRGVNTYGFRRTAVGIDTLRNNIFLNGRSNATSGGFHYAIALNYDTTVTSDRNDLFGNGNGFVTGLLDGTNRNSLFDWFNAAHIDSNSVALNPNFQSANNLHINNTNPSGIESKGFVVAGINTDIDADVRPGPAGSTHGGATAPDLGADEFDGTPISLDMGMYALSKPTVGCHTATDSVVVSIKNFSSQPIDFSVNPVTINVSASGANPFVFPAVNINTGTLAAGLSRNVTISSAYNMSSVGSYVFNAYAITTGDIIPYNDTLSPVTITISGGTSTPSSASICSGLPITLSLTGQTTGGTIQWQRSTNGTTWTNIAAATLNTVSVSPTVTTYYKALTCTNTSSSIDTISVVSVANPTTTGASRCGYGALTLHATSANPIVWFDSSSGGTVQDTGAAFNTIVSATRSYYAAASGNISAPKSVTTTFIGPNNSGGNMFTITALNNVTVTGFDGQAGAGTNTWGIYYRRENIVNVPGSNTNANGWIFVDSASNVVSAGTGLPTTIPINMSVLIPAGSTYSFYVMVFSGPNVIYSPGTGLGNANTTNFDLQVKDGYAGQTFNCTTSPRVFNGAVRYRTSCLSNRVAALATVTAPPAINAVTSSATSCSGDSVQLTATSANVNYRYTWAPTGNLSDSTGASVWATSNSNAEYYLYAHDSITNCNNIDSVSVTAYQRPDINITTNSNPICTGDTLQLDANVPLSYAIGTGFNSNTATTYPAPYGNSTWGARHQMLIRASEMTAAGMVPGYINSLDLQVTNLNGSGALTNFTIKIAATNQTALTDTFQVAAMTTVFTNASYTPVNGVNTHNFSSNFHWNGTSNILLETCFNNLSATANASTRRSNTSFNSCTYYNADSANNCSKAIGTADNVRPNIRFGIRNQFSVLWISNQTLNSTTIGNPFTIPTGTDAYQVTVTDTITGCINTDSDSVEVDPVPTVNLGPDTTACGEIILDAGNIGDGYLWNDSSFFRRLTVDTTGTYFVTVTHLGSCTASDTVNVIVVPAPVVSLTLPVDSFCSGDAAITLSGGIPTGGLYSGPGVTGNSFDPQVAWIGNHFITYTYTDALTGCSDNDSSRVNVQICAGISNPLNVGSINVYPNPFRNELNIDLSSIKEKCIVELMTPESKVVSYNVFNGEAVYPINIEHFASGIYFLKINSAGSNYMMRVIKQE